MRRRKTARLWTATTVLATLLLAAGAPSGSGAAPVSFDEAIRTLVQRARSANTAGQRKTVVFESLSTIDQAIDADDYEAAIRLANLTIDVARRSGNAHALLLANARRERIEVLMKEYRDLRRERDTLGARPGDPEANLKIGRFVCLLKGDWKRGLPLLAASGSAAWRAVALVERKAPEDRAAQMLLGHGWRELAAEAEEPYRRAIEARAYFWYQRALKQSTGNEARNQVRELMKGLSMLYLTDLDEQALKSGPWPFARYGDAGNSRTFTVNGLEYPNGLGLHPSDRNFASVSFAIGGRYDTFTTGAAIADHDVHVAGDIVFWVLGDGKVLWKSKPFKAHGDIQYCQVSVDDVNVLELRTQAVNSAYGGHAVWLDPHASR